MGDMGDDTEPVEVVESTPAPADPEPDTPEPQGPATAPASSTAASDGAAVASSTPAQAKSVSRKPSKRQQRDTRWRQVVASMKVIQRPSSSTAVAGEQGHMLQFMVPLLADMLLLLLPHSQRGSVFGAYHWQHPRKKRRLPCIKPVPL